MDSQRKRNLSKHSFHIKRKEIKKSAFLERLEKHLEGKNINQEIALDNFVYGISCIRVLNNAKTERIILYLDQDDMTVLKMLGHKSQKSQKFRLNIIQDVDFDLERGEIKNYLEKGGNSISELKSSKKYITLLTTKKETFDFIFDLQSDLDNFIKGFLHLLSNIYCDDDNLNEKFIDSIRNIWVKYDKNFSNKLDMDEFKLFAKELNLILNKSFSINELFKSIDKDNSQTIDFDEFIEYYKKFTNGEELKFIFDKYSSYNEFYKEKTLSPQELIIFYREVQKEKIEEIDAKIMILLIKKCLPQEILEKIRVKLDLKQPLTEEENIHIYLKLDEFKVLIYDKLISSVYSSQSTDCVQDMNKPFTDYFLFSSHNTYLTGHQVYGESDPEMYSSALLIGCRLVELDVYNGGQQGPVVKHGFTMTGEILLKDALSNIRKSAFVISDFPVVLSIENHCNEENQIKMANLFNNILIDLFVLEDDTDLFTYPSPNELKRKFIIKAKRKEIYAKTQKIDLNSEAFKPKATLLTLESNKEKLMKFEKRNFLNTQLHIQNNNNFEQPDKKNPNANNNLLCLDNKISKIINTSHMNASNINNSNINYLNHSNIIQVENDRMIDFKFPEESKLNNNLSNQLEAEKIGKELIKQKKKNSPFITKLSQTIGMIGRKLNLEKIKEMNYQFWDCVTKKDNYLIGKSADFNSRKLLVNYCKGSFLKAYPTNFSSDNYDCVKTWILGCQISAVNIQKLDCDNMLLNVVFFRQNQKCGLVLKPKKLRDRNEEYTEQYLKPKKRLNITLISGYMLNLLGFDDETNRFKINLHNLRLEIKFVGSASDDLNNRKFEISIEQNLLNPHFNNIVHSLDIYETNLATIFIYIYTDKEIIGRSVIPLCMLAEGVRCIPIYDLKADEFNDSRLVFKFEYENIQV